MVHLGILNWFYASHVQWSMHWHMTVQVRLNIKFLCYRKDYDVDYRLGFIWSMFSVYVWLASRSDTIGSFTGYLSSTSSLCVTTTNSTGPKFWQLTCCQRLTVLVFCWDIHLRLLITNKKTPIITLLTTFPQQCSTFLPIILYKLIRTQMSKWV